MSIIEIIATALISLGALAMLAGAAGVMRFPDFYTRLHAAGKGDTLGQGLILLGLLLPIGMSLVSFKLALIILFILSTDIVTGACPAILLLTVVAAIISVTVGVITVL